MLKNIKCIFKLFYSVEVYYKKNSALKKSILYSTKHFYNKFINLPEFGIMQTDEEGNSYYNCYLCFAKKGGG